MQADLDKELKRDQRDKFLGEVNAAYAALRGDPKGWKEEQAERAVWDRAQMDGLEMNEGI